jgi:hypothetical protein
MVCSHLLLLYIVDHGNHVFHFVLELRAWRKGTVASNFMDFPEFNVNQTCVNAN